MIHSTRLIRAALVAMTVISAHAATQQPAPPASPPQPLPDLDELLEIRKPAPAQPPASDPAAVPGTAPTKAPTDTNKEELQRRLSGREMDENFKQAVALMGDVAQRLRAGRDTGLPTQRVQDEILRRLDQVIESARAQEQKSSSSSSSSSQSQSRQQPQPRPQPQAQKQNNPQAGEGDNRAEATPPGGQSGKVRDLVESAAASWGALPQRVRDALLQGSGDKFSSLYQALTEEYYRRLAEEGKQPE